MIDSYPRLKIQLSKPPVLLKYLLLFLFALLLIGCQSIQHKSSMCEDLVQMPIHQFELVGKLALSDGQEGGSGRLIWRQENDRVSADFKVPMGQGDWSIEEQQFGATMVVNGEDTYYAEHAQPMVSDVIGWPVPWSALKKWIIAFPLDPAEADIQRQEQRMRITELGWQIEYDRFRQSPLGCLPHRVMAKKPPYTIRLAIRSWQ